jgi:hypothetical protein
MTAHDYVVTARRAAVRDLAAKIAADVDTADTATMAAMVDHLRQLTAELRRAIERPDPVAERQVLLF